MNEVLIYANEFVGRVSGDFVFIRLVFVKTVYLIFLGVSLFIVNFCADCLVLKLIFLDALEDSTELADGKRTDISRRFESSLCILEVFLVSDGFS